MRMRFTWVSMSGTAVSCKVNTIEQSRQMSQALLHDVKEITAMQITAIHHLSLLVANTECALAFYHGLLRLPLASRPELGFPGAWLNIGGQQLHLLELPNPDPVSARPEHAGRDRHLALTVEGLDELIVTLEAGGIPYTRSRSGRAAIFVRDPDGNGVELIAAR